MTIIRQQQTNIGIGSGSYWSGSDGIITRDSEVQITGSLIADTITGSLFGTSSWALNAVYVGIGSGSYWSGSTGIITRDSEVQITGSLLITGSIGIGTESPATQLHAWNNISASVMYARSGSFRYLEVGGDTWVTDDLIVYYTASFGFVSGSIITNDLTVHNTSSLEYLEVDGDTILTEDLIVSSTGSFGLVSATSMSLLGTATSDLLYQNGTNNLLFITEPTASDAILIYSMSSYLWVETIDGGAY